MSGMSKTLQRLLLSCLTLLVTACLILSLVSIAGALVLFR